MSDRVLVQLSLAARAAAVRALSPRRVARPYWSIILWREINQALICRDVSALRGLDRVRDAAGLPPDPCVREFLQENPEKRHVST